MAVSSRRMIALLAGLAMLGALPACSSKPPDDALKTFLAAWEQGNIAGMKFVGTDGKALSGDAAQKLWTSVAGDLAATPPKLTIKGSPAVKKDEASTVVAVKWPVADSTWEYDTTVQAKRVDKQWTVVWGAKTINPELEPTDKIVVKKTAGPRGSILDGSGQPIVSSKPVVIIGVQPRSVTDINIVTKNLTDAFAAAKVQVDLSALPNRVKNAKPDAFVEVVTLRKEVYDTISNKLNSTPGIVTRNSTQTLGPSAQFARALIGTSGEVTKEIMDKNPGKYKVGDVVGLSGIQQKYDTALQGKAGVSVIVPKPTGTPDKKLFTTEAAPGAAIKLTLDVNMQNAAEAALALDTRRSALVAIRISDNSIVAVANGPGAAGNNFALVGQTPPGSTFKTITALGVLTKGTTGETVVPCPKTLTVDGRTFKNSHDMELGNVPLRTDFAKSCNTAFAALAPQLAPDGLAKTAQSVGIGIPWDLGVDVFTGKVSANGSKSEQAAAAFGQGTTLSSPVALAGAAAAIARGQWKQPQLVLDPAPKNPAQDGPQLSQAALDPLRQMMREVVTVGTADQLKDLPGDLRGKTGTAEYDNDPAHTHSWFMGYRGDIAFCVFVENGGASTAAAVPIAGKFFQTIG
ncbi:penicillin-binding transpeptidase domain-containing protein [Dactylosporangium sp. NPDC000521]|uniref:penicillin-binding transpeptidase domain-containing protein n=1 Tax=Dactylosporangium sp. NPDC000521 TaxID=3363975 RepID=UPI003690218D